MKCAPKEIFEPQDYLEELICTLGNGVLKDAVALPCQHVFCQGCIEEYLKTNSVCPTCGEATSLGQVMPQFGVRDLVNGAPVKCPNCFWRGNYGKYENHDCPAAELVPCPQRCGLRIPKIRLEEHLKECRSRTSECPVCKMIITVMEESLHDSLCPELVIPCPRKCGETIKRCKLEEHLKACKKPKSDCPYEFTGCYYCSANPEGASSLVEHKSQNVVKHLELLGKFVSQMKTKLEIYEQGGSLSSIDSSGLSAEKRLDDIFWSNGKKILNGGLSKNWSFYLSNKVISGNFVAKLKIASLGTDSNTWKVCLGIFNSSKYHVGSWEKYQNGFGYILGTGHKVHESSPGPYGEAYKSGDIISIVYKDSNITFYRNQTSQGVAFQNASGPFYLACALSDISHSVEIVEVLQSN